RRVLEPVFLRHKPVQADYQSAPTAAARDLARRAGNAIPLTSLNDSPGGVPLYKNGELVGGIGVTGDGSPNDLAAAAAILIHFDPKTSTVGFKEGADTDEAVALAGQIGYE